MFQRCAMQSANTLQVNFAKALKEKAERFMMHTNVAESRGDECCTQQSRLEALEKENKKLLEEREAHTEMMVILSRTVRSLQLRRHDDTMVEGQLCAEQEGADFLTSAEERRIAILQQDRNNLADEIVGLKQKVETLVVKNRDREVKSHNSLRNMKHQIVALQADRQIFVEQLRSQEAAMKNPTMTMTMRKTDNKIERPRERINCIKSETNERFSSRDVVQTNDHKHFVGRKIGVDDTTILVTENARDDDSTSVGSSASRSMATASTASNTVFTYDSIIATAS